MTIPATVRPSASLADIEEEGADWIIWTRKASGERIIGKWDGRRFHIERAR